MEGGCDMTSARLLRSAAMDRGDNHALTALVRNQKAAASFAVSGWPAESLGSRSEMNLGPPNSSSASSMAGFCPRSRRVQVPTDCKDQTYIRFLQGLNDECQVEWHTMRDQGWVLLTGRDGNSAWARISLEIVPTCPVPGRVTRNKTVLYMCGGNPGRPDGFAVKVRLLSQESIDVLVVDAAYNFNILDDDFFFRLFQNILVGHFAGSLLSPPCCTWSQCLKNNTHGGPRALRAASGPFMLGLPSLTATETLKVQAGNDIAERCVSICNVLGNMQRPFIYEMPAPMPESASQLKLPDMQRLLYERHAWVCTMDQCLAGSVHTKPTAFVTNISSATEPWPAGLCGKCNHSMQIFKYADGELIRRAHPPMLRQKLSRKWRTATAAGRQSLPVLVQDWHPGMNDRAGRFVTNASKTYTECLNANLARHLVQHIEQGPPHQ